MARAKATKELVEEYRAAIEAGAPEGEIKALGMAIEFGRKAHEGKSLKRTIFGAVFEEADGTPFTCSPASETYWSS